MSVSSGPAAAPPVTQKREFWVLMGYAVALGVFGAVAGLVFIGVIKFGGKWYSDSDPGWFGGHWWWVAVAAAAGAVVGLLRRLTRLPAGGSWPVRRPANRARRPATGAGDRGRLDGVADRWRQPRPGKGAGRHGRRGGQLARPAKGARQRGLPGEHPGRLRRRLRRAVLQHGDRGAADPGGRPPGRAAVHQGPRRGDRGIERLVRHLLRHRRRRVPGRLPGAVLQVRGLAAARRGPPGPVRGPGGDAAGWVHDGERRGCSAGSRPRPSRNQRWAAWYSGSSAWHCR